MVQPRLQPLLHKIDDAVEHNEHPTALQLILQNWYDLPDPAPLRERVALLLATVGRKREAVEIYQLVARHYANAGFPTRALATIKQMQALNPSSTQLLDHFTTLYSVRSPFLERDQRQTQIPEPPADIVLEVTDSTDTDTLFSWATDRATDREALADRPGSLPALPLLSLLPPRALRRVLDFLDYEIYAESRPVVGRGADEDALLWAVGSDLIVDRDEQSFRIPAGALLGVSRFLDEPSPDDWSVKSQKGSECLRLSRDAFESLTDEFPDFPSRLATLHRHALTEHLFSHHPIFADLDEEAREQLAHEWMGLKLQTNTSLLQQNKVSPGLYLLLDGCVDIIRHGEATDITIESVEPGEVVGQVGLVEPRPSIVSAVTTEPTHVLYFPRDDFLAFGRRHPSLTEQVQRRAEHQLQTVRKLVADER